jgi:hypothetical protein
MCRASNSHMDYAFQVSPAIKVTCSSVGSDIHTEGIFKSFVLQHPGNA